MFWLSGSAKSESPRRLLIACANSSLTNHPRLSRGSPPGVRTPLDSRRRPARQRCVLKIGSGILSAIFLGRCCQLRPSLHATFVTHCPGRTFPLSLQETTQHFTMQFRKSRWHGFADHLPYVCVPKLFQCISPSEVSGKRL